MAAKKPGKKPKTMKTGTPYLKPGKKGGKKGVSTKKGSKKSGK